MKKLFLTLMTLALATTSYANMSALENSYAKINYKDGINQREAKLIAKKALMDSGDKNLYRFFNPEIVDNRYTYPHQQYLFVHLKRKSLEVARSEYLVIVDKKTGKVVYSDKEYHPTNVLAYNGYRWAVGLHEHK